MDTDIRKNNRNNIEGLVISEINYSFDNRGVVKILSKGNSDFLYTEFLVLQNKKSVLRGMHYQRINPQNKLITCLRGELFVVVVDIRENSGTYGSIYSNAINNFTSIYVPGGCALGTYSMTDTEVLLLCDGEHNFESDTGFPWNDLHFKIDWPFKDNSSIIISDKDLKWPSYSREKDSKR